MNNLNIDLLINVLDPNKILCPVCKDEYVYIKNPSQLFSVVCKNCQISKCKKMITELQKTKRQEPTQRIRRKIKREVKTLKEKITKLVNEK